MAVPIATVEPENPEQGGGLPIGWIVLGALVVIGGVAALFFAQRENKRRAAARAAQQKAAQARARQTVTGVAPVRVGTYPNQAAKSAAPAEKPAAASMNTAAYKPAAPARPVADAKPTAATAAFKPVSAAAPATASQNAQAAGKPVSPYAPPASAAKPADNTRDDTVEQLKKALDSLQTQKKDAAAKPAPEASSPAQDAPRPVGRRTARRMAQQSGNVNEGDDQV